LSIYQPEDDHKSRNMWLILM